MTTSPTIRFQPYRKQAFRGTVFLRGTRKVVWAGRWHEPIFDQKLGWRQVYRNIILGPKEAFASEDEARSELERRVTQHPISESQPKMRRSDGPKPTRYESYVRKGFNLWRKYGLTQDDVDALIQQQCGRCALCREPSDNLFIDHNHATQKVRALLCRYCNSGLGMFRDRPDLLRLAAEYVESHALKPAPSVAP